MPRMATGRLCPNGYGQAATRRTVSARTATRPDGYPPGRLRPGRLQPGRLQPGRLRPGRLRTRTGTARTVTASRASRRRPRPGSSDDGLRRTGGRGPRSRSGPPRSGRAVAAAARRDADGPVPGRGRDRRGGDRVPGRPRDQERGGNAASGTSTPGATATAAGRPARGYVLKQAARWATYPLNKPAASQALRRDEGQSAPITEPAGGHQGGQAGQVGDRHLRHGTSSSRGLAELQGPGLHRLRRHLQPGERDQARPEAPGVHARGEAGPARRADGVRLQHLERRARRASACGPPRPPSASSSTTTTGSPAKVAGFGQARPQGAGRGGGPAPNRLTCREQTRSHRAAFPVRARRGRRAALRALGEGRLLHRGRELRRPRVLPSSSRRRTSPVPCTSATPSTTR